MEVRELTIGGVDSLKSTDGSDTSLILQLIQTDNTQQVPSGVLSDGFQSVEVYFAKAAESLIKNRSSTQVSKPVIKLTKAVCKKSADKLLIVVLEAVILLDNINYTIGIPMKDEEYLKSGSKNPRGSNIIKQAQLTQTQPKPIITPRIETQNTTQTTQMRASAVIPKTTINLSNNKKHSTQPIQRMNQEPQNNSYTPIHMLYPMMQSWCVKARVTQKSDRRNFTNKSKNTPGEFFTIDILDDKGGSINCTFFNDACSKFFERIEQGRVYEFSKGNIKQSRYSGVNQNKYQLNFEDYSVIQEVDDDKKIQVNTFEIKKIESVARMELGSFIDILGVVKDHVSVIQQKLKTGDSKSKRSYFLYDQTGMMEITLWGALAESCDLNKDDIVCVKNLKVSEFMQTRSLQGTAQTVVVSDHVLLHELPEYTELHEWFENNRGKVAFDVPVSDTKRRGIKGLGQIEQVALQNQSNINYKEFDEVRAYVLGINSKNATYYPGCSKCPKKLQHNMMENTYFCQSCQIDVKEPNYKFVLTVKVADATGSLWMTLHDVQSQQLLGIPCKEFVPMDEDTKKTTLNGSLNQERRFQVLTKVEEYNGMPRPRHQVTRILENDYIRETEEILAFLGTPSKIN